MGLFDIFKKKKAALTAEEKLNRLWELWAIGDLKTPVAKLMTYESEVNNGGHSQYFFNVSNCGDLASEVEQVLALLSEPLRGNLERGYTAFSQQEDISDDENEALFEECDAVFFQHEQQLLDLLYAAAADLLI